MSLPNQVEERRRAEERCKCYELANSSAASLRVVLGNGDSWVLPWHRFLHAKLGGDQLVLAFAEYRVEVRGRNLRYPFEKYAYKRDGISDAPSNSGRNQSNCQSKGRSTCRPYPRVIARPGPDRRQQRSYRHETVSADLPLSSTLPWPSNEPFGPWSSSVRSAVFASEWSIEIAQPPILFVALGGHDQVSKIRLP
jgi:hypothetical protein